jgi:Ala-tRNA(Pro) deacylase
MSESFDQLFSLLSNLSLDCTTTDHPAAFTVEEQATHVGHIPGTLTKNLFLKDKKYGSFLLTVLSTREVNVKQVAK